MKEQDYIQIMNRIRKDHIENAMMWEAPVQQNRRSIRRLSAGVGAIAAAIAVCVGVIGYTGSLGMLTATNDIETESAVSGTAETDPSAVTEAVTVYDPASVETTETTSETLPETAPAETNIFGGTGTLRTFQFSDLNSLRFDYQIAEDDEYIYETAKGLRARKTGADTVFEAYDFPGIPDFDQTADHMFVTGGLCFLQKGNTMYAVKPGADSAELEELYTLTEDSDGMRIKNIDYHAVMGFAPDAGGKPTKLFLHADAEYTDSDVLGSMLIGSADLQTGEFRYLDVAGDFANWFVTDDAVYAFSGYMGQDDLWLTQFTQDGESHLSDVSGWNIQDYLRVYISTDQKFFFENQDGKLCSARFGADTPDVISDSYIHAVDRINIGDTDRVISGLMHPARITFGNDVGSEDEILLQGNPDETFRYDLYGVYETGNAVHICAFAADNNSVEYAMVFVTRDGGNVTSYSIPLP